MILDRLDQTSRAPEAPASRNLGRFLEAMAEGIAQQFEALEARHGHSTETLALRAYFSQLQVVAENTGGDDRVDWQAIPYESIAIDLEPEQPPAGEPGP